MSTKLRVETTKIETTIRFAQVPDGHHTSSEEERRQVFQDAPAEGISTLESLRTYISLESTSPLVGRWLRMFEFGDFNDNKAVLTVLLHLVKHGEIGHGSIGLCLLREHIVQSKEIKSFTHLLPVIDRALANIEVASPEQTRNFTEQPESETSDEFNSFPLFM